VTGRGGTRQGGGVDRRGGAVDLTGADDRAARLVEDGDEDAADGGVVLGAEVDRGEHDVGDEVGGRGGGEGGDHLFGALAEETVAVAFHRDVGEGDQGEAEDEEGDGDGDAAEDGDAGADGHGQTGSGARRT
jgi:hypothetical protein